MYVNSITFHGLYDKLSTNIQRQLGQYEKNPANMEKLSQYEIQPIRCENKVGLIWNSDIKLSISVAILKFKIFMKTFSSLRGSTNIQQTIIWNYSCMYYVMTFVTSVQSINNSVIN